MATKVNGVELSNVTISYLETALWSNTVCLPDFEEALDDGYMRVDEDHPLYGIRDGEPFDDYFGIEDFQERALQTAESDVNDFFQYLEKKGLLDRASEYKNYDGIVHDFWLTRNGHGAGFWDGDYADELGRELTEAAKSFGSCDLYVDGDGKVGIL